MLLLTTDQWIVFVTLFFALVLFIKGWWRYDIVSLMALFTVTLFGVVPVNQVFSGFVNPAVITVAAVLVISRGLQNAGVIELIASWLTRVGSRPTAQVSALCGLVISFSAFMNNVGALALLMPVGIKMAKKSLLPASILLLPLAFGSHLGGMITLIGTPPNLIISAYRSEYYGTPFAMFDFAPVGIGVAVAGFIFISLVGWRLVPKRSGTGSLDDLFHISDYLTEVRVVETSKFAGKTLREITRAIDSRVNIVQLVRGSTIRPVPYMYERIKTDDILIIQADLEDVKKFLTESGFVLEEKVSLTREKMESGDIKLLEVSVRPDSTVLGMNVREIDLRARFAVNLLAVSRQGSILLERLNNIRFHTGDVLLLQGSEGTLKETVNVLGFFPLAERGVKIGESRRIFLAVGIFSAAISIAAIGLVPAQIILSIAALLMVLTSLVSVREMYESIDWPVIVLLGAFIPVGQAMESTGGAELIASSLLSFQYLFSAPVLLTLILVVTMFLSDLINNAATAVLMAPISVNIASGLGVSADPFLMAIVIGASSAYLTPVGHQSNALIMGPAGLRFGDYWRLGLPLEIVIAVVSIPLILHFWPL